jgi:hypothetical protein
VSAGVFLLALSYHFGATSAVAQAPGNPVVCALPSSGYDPGGSAYGVTIATANGDVYGAPNEQGPWTRIDNVFTNSTPAARATWGQLKSTYRK